MLIEVRTLALILALSCTFAGCKKDASSDAVSATQNVTATVDTYLPLKLDGVAIQAQLAIHPAESQRGLMYRQSLPKDTGMLFVFDTPRPLAFYMRNTLIPLDIGYFTSDGVLQEIYRMYPGDENSIQSKNSELRYALEMNQGWYANNGLKPGSALDLTTLAEALIARGVKPADVGIPAK